MYMQGAVFGFYTKNSDLQIKKHLKLQQICLS